MLTQPGLHRLFQRRSVDETAVGHLVPGDVLVAAAALRRVVPEQADGLAAARQVGDVGARPIWFLGGDESCKDESWFLGGQPKRHPRPTENQRAMEVVRQS